MLGTFGRFFEPLFLLLTGWPFKKLQKSSLKLFFRFFLGGGAGGRRSSLPFSYKIFLANRFEKLQLKKKREKDGFLSLFSHEWVLHPNLNKHGREKIYNLFLPLLLAGAFKCFLFLLLKGIERQKKKTPSPAKKIYGDFFFRHKKRCIKRKTIFPAFRTGNESERGREIKVSLGPRRREM